MIWLAEVEVRGISDAGPFDGGFTFFPGLQVVSAKNHFGKSLAVKSIAWCLGLERMFGLQDNDASCFPVAVRDVLDFDDARFVPVRSSAAMLTLAREDGARIRLLREIKGNPDEVVDEFAPTLKLQEDCSAVESIPHGLCRNRPRRRHFESLNLEPGLLVRVLHVIAGRQDRRRFVRDVHAAGSPSASC